MERLSELTGAVSALPRGTIFTRYALSLLSSSDIKNAAEVATKWRDTPSVAAILRSAVSVGSTSDPQWAGNLVDYKQAAIEFNELLRPATIIGRLPAARRAPFNTRLVSVVQGVLVAWSGQGMSKPVSELKFAGTTLGLSKAAGVVVLSKELIRSASPGSEAFVRAEMLAAMSSFLDQQFIDPAVAAAPNVHPASVTNGLTPIPAGTDLKAAVGALFAAVPNPVAPVLIAPPAVALKLAGAESAAGNALFPSAQVNGGNVLGAPLLVSGSVPAGILVLLDSAAVLLADDGMTTLSTAEHATLQLDTTPSTPPAAPVSLWQQNLSALLCERFINWVLMRANGCAYVNGIV